MTRKHLFFSNFWNFLWLEILKEDKYLSLRFTICYLRYFLPVSIKFFFDDRCLFRGNVFWPLDHAEFAQINYRVATWQGFTSSTTCCLNTQIFGRDKQVKGKKKGINEQIFLIIVFGPKHYDREVDKLQIKKQTAYFLSYSLLCKQNMKEGTC